MDGYPRSINRHYGPGDLQERILNALREAGKDVDQLTRADLSTFDEFHIGGIEQTRQLASQIPDLGPGTRVLDIGSGLGGPARTLAAEYGCRVTGLDLTEAFCRAAEMLTERVGLTGQIMFKQGNALDMPFEDNAFDVAWTQFAAMNIGDKRRLYEEVRRVVRPGGYFAVHEVMAGQVPDPHFPNFWASEPSISFLRPPDEVRGLLAALGFAEQTWRDLTRQSADWFRAMIQARAEAEHPPVGFNAIVTENLPEKGQNLVRNLDERRICVIQAVFQVVK